MRLIDLMSLELKEFFGQQMPAYAILSHRWEEEEVTYQEFTGGADREAMKGFAKLTSACARAASDGYRYLWVDTCCIDKTSSAELSEAINSMFVWYERAEVCYAYLSDVPTRDLLKDHLLEGSRFRRSQWFQRGWTLQELLAPKVVQFFDQNWQFIGLRNDYPIRIAISKITGIIDFQNFKSASVAQKMSWLSARTTTRVEDMAYCMLGILNVHMPPLYGEEDNAFQRLQLEVLRVSNDESLFAWKSMPETARAYPERGLLAISAAEFKDAGDIVRRSSFGEVPHYAMTNKGLLTHMPRELLTRQVIGHARELCIFSVSLQCAREQGLQPIRIFLWQHGTKLEASRILPDLHVNQRFSEPGLTVKMLPSDRKQPSRDVNGAIYVRQPPSLVMARQQWSRGLHVELDVKGNILQNSLMDMISSERGSLWWIEDAPYHFRLNLDGSRPIALLFKNMSFNSFGSHQSRNHCMLLLHKIRGSLMTVVTNVSDEAFGDKSQLKSTIDAMTRNRAISESPDEVENPVRWWVPRGWNIPLKGVEESLHFESVQNMYTWNCQLSIMGSASQSKL